VLPLIRFLNSSLSLLTLIVIWILFLHLSCKKCSHILFPTVTNIINLSLSTGIFPINSKTVLYVLTSIKSNNDLGNYRPISHLSYMSKLPESVVKLHLVDYLFTNNLHNVFQSACIKLHSTETTLLSVHDHIKATSHHKVACLALLDLSAAFDTIDHYILLEHLSSWFGISAHILSG